MKNVLNYFVRKAFGFKSTATAEDKTLFGHLLRIRQNIQGVYDWLYGRLSGSVDGTVLKRMPMTEAVVDPNGDMGVEPLHRPVLQNSDNLLAHLRLLDGRKITNGYQDGTPADDGLPDGVSLARILCDSSLQPTELIDDNVGWDYADGTCNTMLTFFPNVTNLVLGCKTIKGNGKMISNKSSLQRVEFPHLESYGKPTADSANGIIYGCPNVTELLMPKLSYVNHYSRNGGDASYAMIGNMANLQKVVFGTLTTFTGDWTGYNNFIIACPNLLHLEVGEGTCASMDLRYWSPTLDSSNLSLFLDNFLHFIAERVAEGNFTLTLSAAVFSAIWDADGNPAVVGDGHDDLRAAINTELRYNKKWNVNKA